MEREIENLNDVYNQELRRFIASIDFSYIKTVEGNIIEIIEDYFTQNFKGIISFDDKDLEDKIRENFDYGVERTEQLLKEVHTINFNNLEKFESKDKHSKEERENVIRNLDSNNPVNTFSDLEGRTANLIDDYLIRRNYDNLNYEKYRYTIKSFIKKTIKKEKEEMLLQTKNMLSNQNQNLEKEILNGYKNILLTVDKQLEENIKPQINLVPGLEPILDLPINNEITSEAISNNEELPGDFLK